MGSSATQSKQRYNAGHYAQVKISVPPALADAFKSACVSSGVSMAAKLSQFMAGFIGNPTATKTSPDYNTKRQRRLAVKGIVKQLKLIKEAQERSMNNIPENLQGSGIFDTAEQCVDSLDDAIEILASIY